MLKRETRRKRREARKKKKEEAKTTNASSGDISSSSEDGDDDESYQVTKGGKKEKKGEGGANSNNKYAVISLNYSSMPMTNHDQRFFINVPMGKLPHFDGTNFAKWKHLMRAYLIGLHPSIWEVVCNGIESPVDPKNPTLDKM